MEINWTPGRLIRSPESLTWSAQVSSGQVGGLQERNDLLTPEVWRDEIRCILFGLV
jgi:hypothetical protein